MLYEKTVKVQKNHDKRNVYLNVPREVEKHLNISKGDKAKFIIEDDGAVKLIKENE